VDFKAETFDETGFIGSADAVFLGASERIFEELGLKDLGSLGEDNAFAGNGGGDKSNIFGQAGALYFFDCIHRGNAEDSGLAAAGFLDDARDVLDSDEGAHGVVDDDKFRVFRYVLEGLSDGGLTGDAAFYDTHRLFEVFLANADIEALDFVRARGDDDLRDERARGNAAEAQDDERNAVEFEELLGGLVAHARAETCSSENCDDLTHRN